MMKKSAITAVMGILTGFATASQAQSYLTPRPLNLPAAPKLGATTSPRAQGTQVVKAPRLADAPEKQFALTLSLGTKGTRIQDDNIRASTTASILGVGFTWNATTWLKSELKADYQFATGLAATVYGSEGSPYTGALITEGSVTVAPLEGVEISGGIVETNFNPLLSIYAGDALAGLRERIGTTNKKGWIFGLESYQAVPTQIGTSNRVLDEKNEAYLILNNLNAGYVAERAAFKLAFTKYDFYNMTRAAAADSKFLGNSMIGEEGSPYSFFQYQFKGQEIALQLEKTLRRDDKLILRGTYAVNNSAPEDLKTGWIANLRYDLNVGRYKISPSYTQFNLQSDVMPAFYTRGALGYLNREGYQAEIRGKLLPFNVEAYARYVNSIEIEDRLVQSDRVNYSVGVEVTYDVL
jgi:hypothetical protein